MAGIRGLRALFTGRQFQNVFDQFQQEVDRKTLEAYQFIGETFVNEARISGNYTDRTGNLRSSIGYIILLNGKVVEQNFEGNSKGQSQGKKVAEEVANQYPDGYVLIGVAGMQYAAYVEAKNFDVITGSAPEKELLISILSEI
ncbi:hypothetical protein FORMB_16880 [Formosa sp. Hel1_33_131]|uniref:hypothetical protein n=1 Tax=Formosa sp. Hel1_33_131 TaxID=1336794 RepID=UPI000864E8F6|nr:hypothetical protein [Formosa sp. Hel1_33_131]AOR28727.1 hypothetical protein FORMB_16880 [Formosa sp. Hel1_33_131]